ncbi:MAG: hypothetical protein AB7H92_14100 [Microbacteriaceae bacterium]
MAGYCNAVERVQRLARSDWCAAVEFAFLVGLIDANDIELAFEVDTDVLVMRGLLPAVSPVVV